MRNQILITIVSIGIVIALIVGGLVGIPHYNVWRREMAGRAALAEAEFQRQIIVVEAEALLEAERFNAEAEVIRAQGIAEAMYIINLELNSLYLHHFWIRTMAENANMVYVATEGGFPVLPQLDMIYAN